MKKVMLVSLCIVLGILGIIAGNPLTNNAIIITMVMILISSTYIVYKSIKDKNYRLIENKLDLFIIILVFSSYLPLIFKTYVSLEGTIEYILRYTSILAIYFLVKDLVKENKKLKKYLKNTIIIIGIIVFIFGLDNLTFGISEKLFEILKVPNIIDNNDNRMISTFGYANTFCIAMSISFILSIFACLKENNKILRNFYLIAIHLCETGIILSYSRGGWLITAISCFIIYFTLKKEEKLKYIYILILSSGFTSIFVILFRNLSIKKEYLLIYIVLLILNILIVAANVIFRKLNTNFAFAKFKHILKYKKYIITIIIILITIFIILGLSLSKPLQLFQDKDTSNSEYSERIYNIEPNKEYKLIFDIEAKQSTEFLKNYEIIIEEKNYLYDTINTISEEIGNYIGKKEFNIKTQEETKDLKITFKSKSNTIQRGFKINSLTVNGKNIPLNYVYLPKGMVEKIQNFNIFDVSVQERIEFIKTAVLMGIDNIWTGVGGDGFRYLQGKYQSYYYSISEAHSYIAEIFSEFGILGLFAFISIVIILIKNIIKDIKLKKHDNIPIYVILGLVLSHSMVDFDMSFMYIMTIVYIGFALISNEGKCIYNKNIKIIKIINLAFLTLFIINIYAGSLVIIDDYKSNNNSNIYLEKDILELSDQLEKEPFKDNVEKSYLIIEKIKREDLDEKNKYINEIYNNLVKTKDLDKFNINYYISRLNLILELKELVDDSDIHKLEELEKEEKQYISYILEDNRTRLNNDEKEEYREILEESS